MKKLTVRIDDELNDVIEKNAAKANVSVNKYVGGCKHCRKAGQL